MIVSILGCGWFGMALANALVSGGVTVKGSTTSADKLQILSMANIAAFLIDLYDDSTTVDSDFFNCEVLVIAIPPKTRAGQGAGYVPKLQRAVNAINRNSIKKVILISSTGIYADLNREVNELTNPEPDTASARILSEAEDLFGQQKNFKTAILRFGGLLGPGREPGRFFAARKEIPNGLAPVNLIHLDDCIGITKAIIKNDAFGYTFNACTPHHPPKSEFYISAAIKAGVEPPEFIMELNGWKIINTVNADTILSYTYQIQNWFDWMNDPFK